MIQTYCVNFMGDTICDTRRNPIPLHTPSRREMTMICPHNCLIYDVDNTRVLTSTLRGFYRYSKVICGGHRMSNHLSHLVMCNNPHNTKKEHYGYTS